MKHFLGVALMVVIAWSGCSDDDSGAPGASPTFNPGAPGIVPTSASGDVARAGTWGGDETTLMVTGSGAQFRQGCIGGQIDEPVWVDADGSFDGVGSVRPMPGGQSYPARFSGRVHSNGDRMSLRVEYTNEVGGVVRLEDALEFGFEGPLPGVCE